MKINGETQYPWRAAHYDGEVAVSCSSPLMACSVRPAFGAANSPTRKTMSVRSSVVCPASAGG